MKINENKAVIAGEPDVMENDPLALFVWKA